MDKLIYGIAIGASLYLFVIHLLVIIDGWNDNDRERAEGIAETMRYVMRR